MDHYETCLRLDLENLAKNFRILLTLSLSKENFLFIKKNSYEFFLINNKLSKLRLKLLKMVSACYLDLKKTAKSFFFIIYILVLFNSIY